MKSSVNKFAKGLVQDVSDINESNEAYSDSINGSLIYNKNGNYDWVVQDGNKLSFSINPDNGTDAATKYIPIGAIGDNNIKVIFSVYDAVPTDIRSEIGLFSSDENGIGTYKTLWNDRNDPVSERLLFKSGNQITARFLYENDNTIRVYWVDGVNSDSNPPRVFTFKFNGGDKDNANNYTSVTTSSHSINSQADFKIGILQYVKRISGDLKSGCYQYAYRLITEDGYATPYNTPTRRSFLTTDGINSTDWNLYEMEGSGLDTAFGNQIKITGIDTRYKSIEVCYIYCETPDITTDTKIFTKQTITSNTMTFDHNSLTGTIIPPETVASSFAGITAAKTLDIKGSTLYYGNIIESSNIITDAEKEAIFTNLSITPLIKDMRSDEYSNNRTVAPLTHQIPKTGTLTKQLNQIQGITYTVDNDYVNYKGTQVDKEFSGYWRGETYRFAFVAIDKSGIPLFAIHLADFLFPEQSTTAYNWSRLKADGTIVTTNDTLTEYPWLTDNYNTVAGTDLWNEDSTDPEQNISKIRIMGLEISGIDISGIKNKISGFSIVRTDRDPTIIAQGMALPCVNDVDNPTNTTRPFPFSIQRWQASGGSDFEQVGYRTIHVDEDFLLRPNIIGFYAPDYDFDQSIIPIVQSSDRLRVVGSSFGISANNALQGDNQYRSFFSYYNWRVVPPNRYSPRGGQHTITKQYYTKNTAPFSTAAPYGKYMTEASITDGIRLGLGSQQTYNPSAPINLDTNLHFLSKGNTSTENPEGYTATPDGGEYRGQEKVILYYRTSNFNVGVGTVVPNNATSVCGSQNFLSGTNGMKGGCILNYVRPNTSVYGGLTEVSLEQTLFYSTGHFQPINNETLFPATVNNIYNNIEIWGGDCYVDYVDFLRTYPRYVNNPNSGATVGFKIEADVAHGVCMPYESVLNHSLRQAPSNTDPMYSHVGALPYDTYNSVSGAPGFWSGGLNNEATPLIEEFNLNSVLLQREVVKFFSSETQDFSLINKYPVRWRYTGNKIYGDVIDYWRSFLAFDFKDLNGSYGQITSSVFFNDQIYSFQESSFGRLRAQDRALVNTSIGGLTTGTGGQLDGIDYISNKYGNQHQFSLVSSGNSIYWVDIDKKKAMRFAGDGRVSLSDVRGLHTFFKEESVNFYNKDSPAAGYGICGVYDYENNNVMWTFVRDYHLSLNNDLYIISEGIANSSSASYSNNNTIFVEGDGGDLIFPETGWFSYVNTSSVYYVANKIGGQPVLIKTANSSTSVITTIATVSAGQYYEIKRDSNTEAWTAVQVTLDDVTPFRSTVIYNEDLNSFQGFFAFRPTFYFDHRSLVFSQDKDFVNINNKIYVHNLDSNKATYYEQAYKSHITLNVNEDEFSSKVFDSIRLNGNEKSYTDYSRFLFNTEKQYYYYNVQSDTRTKYLEDSIRMPVRSFSQKDRTRGKFVNFTFEFKNNDDIPVKIYNLITNYRTSNRF